MKNPPAVLEGATVLHVADLGTAVRTGNTTHTVAGTEVWDFAFLALARYGSENQVYLFYCDDEWNVVTDTCHADVPVAIRQAEFEFVGVTFVPVHGAE